MRHRGSQRRHGDEREPVTCKYFTMMKGMRFRQLLLLVAALSVLSDAYISAGAVGWAQLRLPTRFRSASKRRAAVSRAVFLGRRCLQNTGGAAQEGCNAGNSGEEGIPTACGSSAPIFPPPPPTATRAPRVYLGGANLHVGQTVQLSTEQTRYLVSVMRVRAGSLVRVFDGVNGEFLAVVTSGRSGGGRGQTSKSRRSGGGGGGGLQVELRVDKLTRRQPGSGGGGGTGLDTGVPGVELIFAPIRKQRLKMLVEKAVEIGASRLTPVMTARTQKGAVADSKALDKLGLVTAVEAAEQCERMTVPCVEATPVPLLSLLEDLELQSSARRGDSGGAKLLGGQDGAPRRLLPSTLFVCKERDADAPPLLEALAEYARESEEGENDISGDAGGCAAAPENAKAAFLVGPEGGFDPAEISSMAMYPFVRFVSLGPSVLRAETAAVYALSSWTAFWSARKRRSKS